MNQSIVEVVFKVQARTRFGEDVRVSGNVPALGCNDPDRAVELVTSPADFPWWQTKSGMWMNCYHLAITLLSPCYHLAITLLSPCYHLAITLLSPSCHPSCPKDV
jgi:hypothetical protein